MKLYKRLLSTVPLIVVTYFYLRFSLAESGCSGLMDLLFEGVFFIFFATSLLLAFRATIQKGKLYKKKTEPITMTITLITLAALFIGKVFGQGFKGSIWIYAETSRKKLATQNITLRNNGTFRVDLNEVDFSCYYSGQYQKNGDTIILNKEVVKQLHSLLTTRYLLRDSLLIPIGDDKTESKKYNEFVIKRNR